MEQEQGHYLRIAADDLKRTAAGLLMKQGVSRDDAALVGEVLAAADLRGIESHGVGRLDSYYLSRLRQGLINPRPRIQTINDFGATFLLDNDNGLGHPACYRAMQKCIALARKFGIGIGGVRNSNHFGIAGYYSMMALEEGMIGICISNSQPLVIPTCSSKKILGTNPFSIAVPAGRERPFVLDMATSVVPLGKIQVHSRKGLGIPCGWGADSRGRSTLDPAAVIEGGGLYPLGGAPETAGYKGYGLAAAIDIFSGVLSGANFLSGVLSAQDSSKACNVGHFTAAINIEAFADKDSFGERMEVFIKELKEAPLAAGCDQIYVAGEKEFIQWDKNIMEGVPLHEKVWSELTALCKENGIRPPQVLT